MILADTAIRRPVTTIMAFVALALFGVISYLELGVDQFPEVEFPTVTITCVYRGASPETLESKVVEKIEEQIAALNGIDQVRSVCAENVAQVFAFFKLDRDINVAAQDVRDKIAAIRSSLPAEMDSPVIEKLNSGAVPILTLAISGRMSAVALSRYVKDTVKGRIQSVPGVGAIREIGVRDREIKIWIDNDKLNAHHLTAAEVVQAIQSKNIEIPAGKIESDRKEFVVKTMGELTDVDAFKQLTIAKIGNSKVTLGEIATIEDALQDERVAGRLDGKETIALQIRKQSGSNAVKVAKQVKAVIAELMKDAPPGLVIATPVDHSPFIEESIQSVMVDVIVGGILAVFVILIFLRNIESTLISAMAIPCSILTSFIFMRVFGLTLNVLTTMALSLSVGLLIDDAIVVIENIFRHLRMNKTPAEAASDATEEIGLAVSATTFSLVAVFLPVALMGGIVGRFLFHFGIMVSITVVISLIVSFSLTPMLAARYLKREEHEGWISRFIGGGLDRIDDVYRWLLRHSLNHRYIVLAGGVGILALTAYIASFLAFEFRPSQDQNLFVVNFRTAAGTSLEGSKRILATVEKDALAPIASYVSGVFSSIAGDPLEDPTKGQLYVNLVPKPQRPGVSQKQLMQQVRKALSSIPGVERCSVEELDEIAASMGTANQELTFSLLGVDIGVIQKAADKLKIWMAKAGGFVDISDSLEPGKPELHVQLLRDRMEILGVNVGHLAATLNILVGGSQAISQFKDEGKQYDIKLRLMRNFRETPESLSNLMVRSIDGAGTIPLSNVSMLAEKIGPSRISRLNRSREISIGANLDGKAQGTAMKELAAEAGRSLPNGYRGEFQGLSKTAAETAFNMMFAAALASTLVYMLLASQFENFLHPITIMTSIPLSFIGAFSALLLTATRIDIMTMIGLLMLIGLVVKNGILLIEFINQKRHSGLGRDEAILVAGPIRLRPIIMTSACMIGGMIPPAIATGPGAEMRVGMAVAVIGGLLTSTFLTLIILPVFYGLLEDFCGLFGIVAFRPETVAEKKQG